MPSRPRDPQELVEFFDPDDLSPRTAASGPSDLLQKPISAPRLKPISQTATFRKRSTTLRLPALDPAIFHTRATLPRVPAAGQEGIAEEAVTTEPPPAAADLWLIAGPSRPGAGGLLEQRGPLPTRLRMLVLLVLLILLLGAQGFVANLAGECIAQSNQSCLSLSMLQTFAGSQASTTSTSSTMSGASLPAIPNDLPDNVRSFIKLALPYAVQAHQSLGWPTSVVLAQWGLEHGWSVPDAQGYNWGNTTFAPGCPYQGSRFCYASTPAEGLREYIYTAQLQYYDGVRAAVLRGADATALALGQSPWDAGHYGGANQPGSSLLTIMHNFNFYRFDIGG